MQKGRGKGKGKWKAKGGGLNHLFNKKNQSWKHKFFCLAFCNQQYIPTTDYEKDKLLQAGLGEKEILFEDIEIDSIQFKNVLFESFPRLKDGGGFQFYKCIPNTKLLEPLSTVTLTSPSVLKDRAGKARTYVCPIQKDLDLSPVYDLPSVVSSMQFTLIRSLK